MSYLCIIIISFCSYFRCLAQTPSSKEKFNINLSSFMDKNEDEEDSDSDSDDEENIKKRQ